MAGSTILMYHRIGEIDLDPFGLFVRKRHFEEHLQAVRDAYDPVSLNELVSRLRSGRTIENLVALTFDDGYRDVIRHALPLIEKYQVPATIFITTGNIGFRCEFMWDALEQIFLLPTALPERLHISVCGEEFDFDLSGEVDWSGSDRQSAGFGNGYASRRRAAFDICHRWLRFQPLIAKLNSSMRYSQKPELLGRNVRATAL